MYVKNRMTTNLVVVDPNQTISEVLDLMQENNIHRVPVVSNNKLVGLVTQGVVLKNSPSNASSLSIHEMNYLLSKTKISDIMIKNVTTIEPDDLLEKAADVMQSHDIGCLPVVEDDNVLVGIITTNDILQSFADLLGYNRKGTRIVLEFNEDKPGIMEGLTHVFTQENINLTHITAHSNGKVEFVMRCDNTDHKYLEALLSKNGYKILSMI
jgi:acetoin utilization protein AcuB